MKIALEAMDAYKEICSKSQKSVEDLRVLELLDEDMEDLFQIFVEEESYKKSDLISNQF